MVDRPSCHSCFCVKTVQNITSQCHSIGIYMYRWASMNGGPYEWRTLWMTTLWMADQNQRTKCMTSQLRQGCTVVIPILRNVKMILIVHPTAIAYSCTAASHPDTVQCKQPTLRAMHCCRSCPSSTTVWFCTDQRHAWHRNFHTYEYQTLLRPQGVLGFG